jgi:hypothetical protein
VRAAGSNDAVQTSDDSTTQKASVHHGLHLNSAVVKPIVTCVLTFKGVNLVVDATGDWHSVALRGMAQRMPTRGTGFKSKRKLLGRQQHAKAVAWSYLVKVAVDLCTCLVQCCDWRTRQLKLTPWLQRHTLTIQLHTWGGGRQTRHNKHKHMPPAT